MKINVLPIETQAAHGFNHEIVLTHEDLTETTANTAQVIDILDLTTGQCVERLAWEVETYFTDASDAALNTTTLLLKRGSTTLIAATEINSNGTEVARARLDTPSTSTASETLTATFGSMAAKSLSDIDAGEVRIFLRLSDPVALAATLD